MIFLIITLISLALGGIIMFISNVLDLRIAPYFSFISMWFIPKEIHNVLEISVSMSYFIAVIINIIFFPYAIIIWAIELYGFILPYLESILKSILKK